MLPIGPWRPDWTETEKEPRCVQSLTAQVCTELRSFWSSKCKTDRPHEIPFGDRTFLNPSCRNHKSYWEYCLSHWHRLLLRVQLSKTSVSDVYWESKAYYTLIQIHAWNHLLMHVHLDSFSLTHKCTHSFNSHTFRRTSAFVSQCDGWVLMDTKTVNLML